MTMTIKEIDIVTKQVYKNVSRTVMGEVSYSQVAMNRLRAASIETTGRIIAAIISRGCDIENLHLDESNDKTNMPTGASLSD